MTEDGGRKQGGIGEPGLPTGMPVGERVAVGKRSGNFICCNSAACMTRPLKVLLVEDNPSDTVLLLQALRDAGFVPEWKRVDSESDYLAGLLTGVELVLSDCTLPQFSGQRALELLVKSGRDTPFIVVTGTIGDEAAVKMMKLGAADFLLKDRLGRLGPAIESVLEQARLRRDRRQAEEALREAHSQLNHLVARSPTVIYSLKVAGWEVRPRFVSENIFALSGFTAEETLRPEWWLSQLHPEDREVALAGQRAAIEQGVCRVEYRIRHKDGRYLWVEDRKRMPLGAENGSREIVGGWTDITARKQAQEAAREIEERFRQVVENIHEVFWMIDMATSRMLYVSPGYEDIWGRSCESVYQSDQSWGATIHADDRARIAEAAAVRQTGGAYDETYRIVRPDGTVRWIRDRAFPVKDAKGKVRRLVGVAEDITEQKQMEEKFLRAQRMEAVGALTSGVAHDLNNILAPMLMVAGLLKGKLTEAHDREMLAIVESSAQRGAGIIAQLLAFSRGGEGVRSRIPPRHLVKEMVSILQETFPRDIRIESEVPADLWDVMADATHLHQVIMNLCVNARDAMPDGGKLTLTVKNVQLTGSEVQGHSRAAAGPHVLVTVTDTGHGIPAEIMDRIFDPFFTTKEIGKGTGLGLSTVVGIVKNHGGFVTAYSEAGHGTVFKVYLPAVTGSAPVFAKETAPPFQTAGNELILIVDDEALIREATQAVLEKHGYRVVTAGTGEEAIQMFIRHRVAIRLVLTDVMMPGMGGLALIRSLRVLEPGIRVVASSGMDQEEKQAELAALGIREILAKPYTQVQLLKTLERALARKNGIAAGSIAAPAGPAARRL